MDGKTSLIHTELYNKGLLKDVSDHLIVTESKMDNAELAVVLCPRHDNEWPEFVNLLRLWK